MSRFQCLLLMAACLAVTFCLWPTVVVFLVWDAVAVARDHWRYDPRYVTGWNLPFAVPIEELVFFIVIPVCGRFPLDVPMEDFRYGFALVTGAILLWERRGPPRAAPTMATRTAWRLSGRGRRRRPRAHTGQRTTPR